jgi:chromosome segregation ATPase
MGRILNLLTANGVHLAQENKRQVLALDREFEDIEAKITTLQSENLNLQAKVNPLERKIEQLTDQIQRMQSGAVVAGAEQLEPSAEKLLLTIANRGRIDGSFAALLKVTNAQADYYVSVLKRRGFIRYVHSYTGDSGFVATADGLEYLHRKGLL